MSPRSPDARTTQALALADEVAAQMFARFRRRIALDELQSLARSSALDAAARWDGRGTFARFVVQRTRWGVLGAVRVRRRLGPQPVREAFRTAAAFSAEQAADATALELDAGAAPVSIEETRDLSSGGGEAQATAERAAALQDLLGRAAARFAIELDAAEVRAIADPSIDVEAEADRMRVRRAVEALPEKERVVVERHGYHGETFEEIAAAEGEQRSTVFSRFSRALERLRRALGS